MIPRYLRVRSGLRELRYRNLYRKYRDATMIHRSAFTTNLHLAEASLRRQKSTAAIVECGTWRGGMSAALIEIGGPERDYFFFDSFEGLPPPGPQDGQRAARWSEESEPEWYFNNNSASLEEFQATLGRVHPIAPKIHVHKGWFETTLARFKSPPIGVLRLDGDWYASTLTCLTHLWDQVVENGIVLIDDYYAWQGCRMAVHDFLVQRKLTVAIRQGRDEVAYIIKSADGSLQNQAEVEDQIRRVPDGAS
jgi:O-methyltransferase